MTVDFHGLGQLIFNALRETYSENTGTSLLQDADNKSDQVHNVLCLAKRHDRLSFRPCMRNPTIGSQLVSLLTRNLLHQAEKAGLAYLHGEMAVDQTHST